MKLSERSIKIKELISGQVDMGTFGLVELELIEFDKELHELKKLRVADVSGQVCPLCYGRGEYHIGGSFGGNVQIVRCSCGQTLR